MISAWRSQRDATDHRLIIEHHAFARPHRGRRGSEISEYEECLSSHFWAFGRYHIYYFSMGREESIKLRAQLFRVDLVIEIVDVERRVWLRLSHVGNSLARIRRVLCGGV